MMEMKTAQQAGLPIHFFTGTFDDEHLGDMYDYTVAKNFMKRLRRKFPKARFASKPELGEINGRFHMHFVLFGGHGSEHPDQKYTSPWNDHKQAYETNELWPYGKSESEPIIEALVKYFAHYMSRQKLWHKSK